MKSLLALSLAVNVALVAALVFVEQRRAPIKAFDLSQVMNRETGSPAAISNAAFRTQHLSRGTQLTLPVQSFDDRGVFGSYVYGTLGSWSPFAEYPLHGRILPVTSEAGIRLLSEAPRVDATVNGVAALLAWFVECQWTLCAEALPNPLGAPWRDVMADAGRVGEAARDIVSVLRTVLLSQGIVSRAVSFEFSDGPGGLSHVFLEVWVEDLEQWIYVDPRYRVYAPRSTGELIADGTLEDIVRFSVPAGDPGADGRAARDAALARAFMDGWTHWSVANGLTGVRLVYLDPKHYGAAAQIPDLRFGPFEVDLTY